MPPASKPAPLLSCLPPRVGSARQGSRPLRALRHAAWSVCLAALWLLPGCQNGQGATGMQAVSQTAVSNDGTTSASSNPAALPAANTALPAGTSPASASSDRHRKPPVFDAQAAFTLLEKQCDFGPRPLGAPAHEKTKTFLLEEMKKYADVTIPQTFSYRGLTVTNVIGVFYPGESTAPAKNPVLLITHWDSRPIADGPNSPEALKTPAYRFGPKGWNRTNPILAANDGASGTAVLLQLARMFKQQKPPVGVVIVLDDGEDYGDFRANNNAGEGVELGSRYFATHFQEDSRFGYPDYGILLDMVGGKDLLLPREENSYKYAPGTMTKVYQAALVLGYKNIFRDDLTTSVEDDHIALNQAKIPTIDLIPYFGTGPVGVKTYPYWHTLQDTPDKCSAQSLKIVGETVAEVIYNETPAP